MKAAVVSAIVVSRALPRVRPISVNMDAKFLARGRPPKPSAPHPVRQFGRRVPGRNENRPATGAGWFKLRP